jgi:hypothetical protein
MKTDWLVPVGIALMLLSLVMQLISTESLDAKMISPKVINSVPGVFQFEITVMNSGTMAWSKDENFSLGIYGLDENGKRVQVIRLEDGTDRVHLPQDLAPGEGWNVELTLHIPPEASGRPIYLQMVQDGDHWFGESLIATQRSQQNEEGKDRGAPRHYAMALRTRFTEENMDLNAKNRLV